jgi:G:T-mismatch repair DNA endonuclease (very short patch repair protein)
MSFGGHFAGTAVKVMAIKDDKALCLVHTCFWIGHEWISLESLTNPEHFVQPSL